VPNSSAKVSGYTVAGLKIGYDALFFTAAYFLAGK